MTRISLLVKFTKATLLLLFFGLFTQIASAQEGTAILPFEDGKIITSSDLSFLNLIVNGSGMEATSRGASKEITIGKTKLAVGSKITKSDAMEINKLIKIDSEKQASMISKSPQESPQAKARDQQSWCGYCCYYYYWDSYCGCYMYRWYYCCAC